MGTSQPSCFHICNKNGLFLSSQCPIPRFYMRPHPHGLHRPHSSNTNVNFRWELWDITEAPCRFALWASSAWPLSSACGNTGFSQHWPLFVGFGHCSQAYSVLCCSHRASETVCCRKNRHLFLASLKAGVLVETRASLRSIFGALHVAQGKWRDNESKFSVSSAVFNAVVSSLTFIFKSHCIMHFSP